MASKIGSKYKDPTSNTSGDREWDNETAFPFGQKAILVALEGMISTMDLGDPSLEAVHRVYESPYDTVTECLEGFTNDLYEEERCICMWFPEDADSTMDCNTEKTYWYHSDYIGHTEFITDEAGRPYQYMAYMPFGEQYVDQHANNGFYSSAFRFNGKEYDEYTGQYYYGARYLDPLHGTWLSVDPLANLFPSISGYSMSANNPISILDPDGRVIVWSNNPETDKVKKLMNAYAKTNPYFRAMLEDLQKTKKFSITIDAGENAQEYINKIEKESRIARTSNGQSVIANDNIRGLYLTSKNTLMLDEYDIDVIFEELFHAYQDMWWSISGARKKYWLLGYATPNAPYKEAEASYFISFYSPENMSTLDVNALSGMEIGQLDLDAGASIYSIIESEVNLYRLSFRDAAVRGNYGPTYAGSQNNSYPLASIKLYRSTNYKRIHGNTGSGMYQTHKTNTDAIE